MARKCARPGCNAPAVATFNFDGLRRVVWVGPLDVAVGRSAGDLCRRHADLLRPPLHWEVRDVRPAPTPTYPAPAAPSRYVAPGPPLEPVGVAARADAPDGAREPTSPLLSRAFRAAG
jgi:hypothetical protein